MRLSGWQEAPLFDETDGLVAAKLLVNDHIIRREEVGPTADGQNGGTVIHHLSKRRPNGWRCALNSTAGGRSI
ncbi:MAG: hypothetical protein CFE34_01055 [Rhodobacteraceae bacterium PARR1]|nr:MAG: hypothetical protein CFE34_01055 [Rhodobacteraceae bacterium PARR1]